VQLGTFALQVSKGVEVVFGRKDIGKDNGARFEAQNQHLAETEAAMVSLEQGIGRLPSYQAQFPHAWYESKELDDAVEFASQAREVLNGIKAQHATASQPSAVIEEHLRTIDELVAFRLTILDSFAAILIGRQHLWNAAGENPGNHFNPTVREAQQALHADATRLAAAVQEHIDELRPLRERHRDYWPPNLELDHIQAYLDEGREALDVYAARIAENDQPLSPKSSIELLALAQRMEKGVEMIETERQNLAVTIVTRAAVKRDGPS
jgi:hypothetical protein